VGYPSMPEDGAGQQSAAVPDEILLPAPQLIVSAKREQQFPVRATDWQQLRASVASLASPRPSLVSLGWACIGITGAAAFAYFPWIAAYSQLPAKAQQHYAYIAPLLAMISIAFAVIAIFSFFIDVKIARMRHESAEQTIAYMDTIYKPDHSADVQERPPSGAREASQISADP
jgi:hypothetical protein